MKEKGAPGSLGLENLQNARIVYLCTKDFSVLSGSEWKVSMICSREGYPLFILLGWSSVLTAFLMVWSMHWDLVESFLVS
jgi:hypothetical protein